MEGAQKISQKHNKKFEKDFLKGLKEHTFHIGRTFPKSEKKDENVKKSGEAAKTEMVACLQIFLPNIKMLELLQKQGIQKKSNESTVTIPLQKFSPEFAKEIRSLHTEQIVYRPVRELPKEQKAEDKSTSTNIKEVKSYSLHDKNALESTLSTKQH